MAIGNVHWNIHGLFFGIMVNTSMMAEADPEHCEGLILNGSAKNRTRGRTDTL